MGKKNLLRQAGAMAKDSWYVYCMTHKKLDKKTILLESKNGEEIGSNIFYMLVELSQNKYKDFHIYVAVNKDKIQKAQYLLANKGIHGIKVLERYGLKYFCILATAGYLVTDTTFPRRFLKREGQVYMNTWHGTSFKKLGKDIPEGAYVIGNVQRNFLMTDYLVSPSNYALQKLIESHNLENLYQGKYIVSGYPRNQVFFRDKEREDLRKNLGLEKKRVYCYMPTWRGVVREQDAAVNAEKQIQNIQSCLEELDNNLKDDEILYLRLHPFVGQRIACDKFRHIQSFPEGFDTYEVLNLAECLITDYSSVFFDFANKKSGKIILFLYDRENFQEERDWYFSPDMLPFPVTSTVSELIKELRMPPNYSAQEFYEKYCPCDGEHAAQELCQLLLTGTPSGKISFQSVRRNNKKNLLFYVGGLRRNGLTSSFLNLMEYMDRDSYNVYASFQEEYLKETPERIGILPEFIQILPMSSGWNLTFLEAAASYLFYKKDRSNAFVRRYLKRFYTREYKRNFGSAAFEWCIHFTGYERKVTGMFQCAPGKRAIFVHSDMLREIELRKNQHLLTLKKAYQQYDLVLPVSKDIYESTLSISGKKENLYVVNNCHAYLQTLKRAEQPFSFDETTRCTLSYEELCRQMESPQKKFITIGRFSPEKGHGMLLEAFAAYHREQPESMLIIIGGGGDLYEQTREKAESLGIKDSVILLMSVDNPMPVLKKCDLFILSSFYEGLGLVLLEADTLGIPVISTDIPGPRGFMKKYGGFLVPPTPEGLLEGLHSFDRGEVKVLHVDYEAYNKAAIKEFMELIKEG